MARLYLVVYNLFSTLSWSYLLFRTLQHVLLPPHQLTSTYSALGHIVPYVQTTAILEVLHVLLGWVRSPLPTTIIQVSSRLLLVWGITEQFNSVRLLDSLLRFTHTQPRPKPTFCTQP